MPQSNGKNGKGQFVKGNTAGTVGKRAESKHKEKLAAAFNASVSECDIRKIARALVKKACEGDTKAAQQVLDRCLGKVKETTELTGSKSFIDALSGAISGSGD